MVDEATLRRQIREAAPRLWTRIKGLVEPWTGPIIENLNRKGGGKPPFPRTFNDPVWGGIELFPWECAILDSPLLQRLRGIRQLGLAHHVYPSAQHTRFEHTLGVVEAAQRMIESLQKNARHHQSFGTDQDPDVPLPEQFDVRSTRLAALLHDIGHGTFSHVTEPLIRACFSEEFKQVDEILRQEFEGVTKIATSEAVAVLFVMSEGMQKVLEHPALGAVNRPKDLAPAIASRILGSRSCLTATYLSGVISGPLDADKLDYMARDSLHTGLPIAMDVNRLISKLEVVIVTPDNAPNPDLRQRAEGEPRRRFYEMGISLAGLSAFEQMIVGRVILYDRLYHHHKVRAAEALVRSLFAVVADETGGPPQIDEFYSEVSDDGVIAVLAGHLKSRAIKSGQQWAQTMGTALLSRNLYHRAFAFASRFIGGLDRMPEEEQDETRALLWTSVVNFLCDNDKAVRELASWIHDKATKLAEIIPELGELGKSLSREHILVDLPVSKAGPRGSDILTRTEGGQIATPNLFFDPERWSQAYESQKYSGFVFCPKRFVPLVALASDIVFFDNLGSS